MRIIFRIKLIFFTVVILTNLHSYAASKETDLIDDIINSLKQDIEPSNMLEEKEDDSFIYKDKAKIIILNKITAKSNMVELKLNEIRFFGNLSIEVAKCAKNKDPIKSSNFMLIKVFDNKPDDDRILIFNGWVDSANPSISSVEHAVYEVMPQECID